MASALARLRRRGQDGQDGFTMVEMAVAIGLLSVVLTIFLSVLVSVQNAVSRQASRSQSNDQGRLAVEELDREIRSGNVLYNPANENDPTHFIFPNMSLRIYTQANAPTREAGGLPGERCVQWRIKYNKTAANYELQRRDWTIGATTSSAWQVIASNVMNRAVSPQQSAFAIDPAKRIVNIALLANNSTQKGNTVEIDTTVEGRNTVYGDSDPCSPIPTYPTPDPAES